MRAGEQDGITLDSTYFVAFELMHRALKSGLKSASDLSITQYRALVKLLGVSPNMLGQSDLGEMLGAKPNVMTQALNALEARGLAKRARDDRDGRSRSVGITQAGVAHVASVNDSIVRQLYARFPTDDPTYRRILEASIIAGAAIDPPLSPEAARRFPASRTLVSFELIRHMMEKNLESACGASYHECRIMQRLDEEGGPLRIGDLAEALQLSAVNVARCVDRLAERGWVERMRSPRDRKAVFAVVTESGALQQRIIARTVDDMGRTQLWGKLGPEHRKAIAQVGSVVFADLQTRKEVERKAALDLLAPL